MPMHPLAALSLIIVGLVLTIAGSDQLVRGAASLARRLGLSPFVIGVTIVPFGTSAPELFTSVRASLAGFGDLAAGNVIGSNIANIGLILGIAAVLRPIAVSRSVVVRDAPIMVGVSLLAMVIMLDSTISRIEGALFFASIGLYIWYNYACGKTDSAAEDRDASQEDDTPKPEGSIFGNCLRTSIGLVGLLAGAWLLVTGGVDLARSLGVSELIIGATVIAFGTSVPELAASIQAAIRKESDIAIGNIIGSNVFNILVVLGASALAAPIGVSQDMLRIHVPVMIATAVLIVPMMRIGYRVGRVDGALLLTLYLGYTGYLVSTLVA